MRMRAHYCSTCMTESGHPLECRLYRSTPDTTTAHTLAKLAVGPGGRAETTSTAIGAIYTGSPSTILYLMPLWHTKTMLVLLLTLR